MDNFKKFFSGPKIIFPILGVIILIEVVYAVKVLTAPLPAPSPLPVSKTAAPLIGGNIALSADKTTLTVGEPVSVAVLFNSGGHTLDGADLIVNFDPKVLEVIPGGLVKGGVFDEYPLLSVDKNKGLIAVSGVNTIREGFKGIGQLATINFKAKAKGQTSVTIDFEKDSTADSNLVEAGVPKDILENVSNLELNVQ